MTITVTVFKEDDIPVAMDLTDDDLTEQGRARLTGTPDSGRLFDKDITESGLKKMLQATGGRMGVYKL